MPRNRMAVSARKTPFFLPFLHNDTTATNNSNNSNNNNDVISIVIIKRILKFPLGRPRSSVRQSEARVPKGMSKTMRSPIVM